MAAFLFTTNIRASALCSFPIIFTTLAFISPLRVDLIHSQIPTPVTHSCSYSQWAIISLSSSLQKREEKGGEKKKKKKKKKTPARALPLSALALARN